METIGSFLAQITIISWIVGGHIEKPAQRRFYGENTYTILGAGEDPQKSFEGSRRHFLLSKF